MKLQNFKWGTLLYVLAYNKKAVKCVSSFWFNCSCNMLITYLLIQALINVLSSSRLEGQDVAGVGKQIWDN